MLTAEFMPEIEHNKNILVKSLCKLHSSTGKEPPALLNNYEYYVQMHEISVKSFIKNLQGTWELVEFKADQENILVYFKSLLIFIKELWHQNYPCNILYADADTLNWKPLNIFEKFTDFRIFTDNDFPKHGDYFNGGVKYYPSTLTPYFWQQIDAILENWNFDVWEYEQASQVNLMLSLPDFDTTKSQDWVVRQIGFSHKRLIEEVNSVASIKQAILHFHSSQNPQFRLLCMEQIWDKIKND
jgi:hypothetical protein